MSKPVLALLSGWGIDSAVFAPLSEPLRQNYSLIELSYPQLADGDQFNANQISEYLLNQLPEPAILLGWSLGGALAVDLAGYAPDRVRALVTLGFNPGFVASESWPGMEPQLFEQFLVNYQSSPQKTLLRFSSLVVGGSTRQREGQRALKPLLLEPNATQYRLLQELARPRQALLNRLQGSQLHLFAEHDALVPIAVAEALNDNVPRAVVRQINEASHLMFWDKPDEVAALICAWLDEALNDAR